MPSELTCFKSYDIRGELNKNFDEAICYRISKAFATFLNATTIIIGRDARGSSSSLSDSICQALFDAGVKVLDLGLAGTEEMYWATTQYGACGGIEVTASHNPINFNGLKLVKSGSKPISAEELLEIKFLAEKTPPDTLRSTGTRVNIALDARRKYVQKVLSFVEVDKLKPFKIVVNSGNGAAGPTFDSIAAEMSKLKSKVKFERVHHNVDSSFPNGIPNPILPETHSWTRNKILETEADLGVAFDGDFDRCFFFDENGDFVPSQYVVALLAKVFLLKEPRATIIHDPRAIWSIQDMVKATGGTSVVSLTGHAFVKRLMREKRAVYGGEMSAHHYFKDFSYCDSGMIPWLLVAELMSITGIPLSKLVADQKSKFPSSGELNFNIENIDKSIKKVEEFYKETYISKEYLDGLSLSFDTWRFNLRGSNTEPVVRLNVESKGNMSLIERKVTEIKSLLNS